MFSDFYIFIFFGILISVSLLFRRISGLEDPLIWAFYIPAGISFLLLDDIPKNSDYFTVLYILLFAYLIIFFSNPKFSLPKSIFKNTLRTLVVASLFGLLFTSLDLVFNTNLDNSIYSRGTFDYRGDLSIPGLRFAAGALGELVFPSIILTKKFSDQIIIRKPTSTNITGQR